MVKPQSVKSGAAAMPIMPATISGRALAIIAMIQPPIDEPTSTTGPCTAVSIIRRASSRQVASVSSSKLPSLSPQPE